MRDLVVLIFGEFLVSLLVALAALCAFIWAAASGLLRNVEQVKYQVLDVEHGNSKHGNSKHGDRALGGMGGPFGAPHEEGEAPVTSSDESDPGTGGRTYDRRA